MYRVALAVTASVAVASAPARAEPKISVHAAGTASGGYTDNVLSAPDDPPPGEQPPEADVFTELSPSALVIIDTPRTLNEVSYGVRLLLFAENEAANSLNHQGDWRGVYLTSPLSQLAVNARFRAGQANAFATDGGAEGSRVGVLPFGGDGFIATELGQEFALQVTRAWSVEQSSSFELQTAGDTRGLEAGLGGSARRAWRRTDVALRAGGRFVELHRDTLDGPFDQRAAIGDARAAASRDLGRRWNVRGEVGGRVLSAIDGSFSPTFGPVGLASAAYGNEYGELSLTVEHTLEPSLFVARNTTSDRAVLRTRLPVPIWKDASGRSRLGVTGSVGYQRLETLALADLETEATSEVFLGDLGAVVVPTRDFTVTLRYQYRRQEADAELAETLPSFERSTVILSLVGVYPRPEIEARRRLRSSRRIDEREARGEEELE